MSELAHDLRAIGQDLEELRLFDFDMKWDGEAYIVTGQRRVEETPPPPEPEKSVSGLLKKLLGSPTEPPPPVIRIEDVELRYTRSKVDELRRSGLSRRESTPAASEDFTVSQVLRVVGSFVDLKSATLLELTKKKSRLTIVFETAQGSRQTQEHEVSSLYDLATHLYRKRQRSSSEPASR